MHRVPGICIEGVEVVNSTFFGSVRLQAKCWILAIKFQLPQNAAQCYCILGILQQKSYAVKLNRQKIMCICYFNISKIKSQYLLSKLKHLKISVLMTELLISIRYILMILQNYIFRITPNKSNI